METFLTAAELPKSMHGPYPYLRCQTKLNLQPFGKALRIVDLAVVNSKVGLEPLPSFIPCETDVKRVIIWRWPGVRYAYGSLWWF